MGKHFKLFCLKSSGIQGVKGQWWSKSGEIEIYLISKKPEINFQDIFNTRH